MKNNFLQKLKFYANSTFHNIFNFQGKHRIQAFSATKATPDLMFSIRNQ